ncbi:MAG: YtxH domain-containing protein [Dehalococcoidia bacterium]|jgi:gas vesicle protein|nr:YtxH domain-containing protein [Dehalococcoidia bacterium]
MMERSNKLTTGLIAGAVVGAVAGLLLAPKPGKETRHMFASRAGDYAGTLRHRIGKRNGRSLAEVSAD